MSAELFPWQEGDWQQLQDMRARMPHAILFHGAQGIGKSFFAERFAQSVLCQRPLKNGHPCNEGDPCASCRWFLQYSHPDYRRVRPEWLDEDGADADVAEGETAAESEKVNKPAKAPSKEIKIDQIRDLAPLMNIATHRQGLRVIVLYPAEALNAAASNALLKTLEEPAPDTLFLLVSNSLDRLLPTILSRCRKFALTMPTRQQALLWLQQKGVQDPESWLSEQGGAPLDAYALAQSGSRDEMEAWLQHLAAPTAEGVLKTAEQLQKTPLAQLVAWLQRWLYDLLSFKLSGRIRYYPKYQKELATLARQVDARLLLRSIKALNQRRAIANHPLSAKLFIEDMLLDYCALCS